MGYVPLKQGPNQSDEEYRAYLVWALCQTWSGRRWYRRYEAKRAKAVKA